MVVTDDGLARVHEACTRMNSETVHYEDCAYWTNGVGGMFHGRKHLPAPNAGMVCHRHTNETSYVDCTLSGNTLSCI